MEGNEKKEEKQEEKRELHLQDGTKVPGATTITGQLGNPFLTKWANKLGKQNIDVEEYTKNRARQGELIHMIIQSHLMKCDIDLSNYKDNEIILAEQAFDRYLVWEKEHLIENVEVEKELVSEIYKYGGFLDIYCKLDGKYTVIDIKTSKDIGLDQKLQVSSYVQLLRENNLPVEQYMILNTGKQVDSDLQIYFLNENEVIKYCKLFNKLVELYHIRREMGWK